MRFSSFYFSRVFFLDFTIILLSVWPRLCTILHCLRIKHKPIVSTNIISRKLSAQIFKIKTYTEKLKTHEVYCCLSTQKKILLLRWQRTFAFKFFFSNRTEDNKRNKIRLIHPEFGYSCCRLLGIISARTGVFTSPKIRR